MKRMSCGIALGIVLLVGLPASAQTPAGGGQPAPPPMTNLQVWPKDTSPAIVLQFMNAFDDSLGVQCNYCHVQQGGRFDFASDEKRENKPAGAGPTSGDGHPGAPVRVLCSSCHRGLPVPASIADVVTDAATSGGAAGLAKFKELRARYYGGQQYDFTENALLTIAQRAMNAKSPDNAIAYLQANLEYYPKSARTYQAMAQARNAKGDKPGAIKDLEKAVELDPENAQARNQLQQLRGR
jgi:hypothetical protein